MEITVIRPEECPERFFRITSGDKTVYCRGNDAVSLPCEDGRFTVATAEKRDYLNFRIKNRILRALHIGVTAVLSVPFRIIAMFTDAYSGSYALGEFTAYSDCDPFVTEREFEVQNTGETVTLRYIPPVLRKPTAVFLPPDIKGDIPCTGGKTCPCDPHKSSVARYPLYRRKNCIPRRKPQITLAEKLSPRGNTFSCHTARRCGLFSFLRYQTDITARTER